MSEKTTFIQPGYRRTSAGHKPIDGVQFHSYHTGILRYARISEDGQIMTAAHHRASTYEAAVIGHGYLRGPDGKKTKRFRTQDAAALAAIKVWRKMHEGKK